MCGCPGYGYGEGGGWIWLIIIIIFFVLFFNNGRNNYPNHGPGNNPCC